MNKTWQYFIITVAISFSPTLCRLCVSLVFEIKLYDTKDTLFAALALLLSNVTLVGDSDNTPAKKNILYGSIIMLLPIAFFLCGLLSKEDNVNFHLKIIPLLTLHIFTFISLIISFVANKVIYKTV